MTMAVEGTTAGEAAAADRSDDRAVPAQGFWSLTCLVCFAHFWSHFFQFLLPSLFPVLKAYYGVGYTELGVLATAFYLASGLAQTPAGFAVDRFGAPRVLAGGLLLLAVSFAGIAAAPPFAMLLPLMVAAGLGNSVFHPADYTILGHRIAPARVGRAFALHALSGTLGYAAAPAAMVALAGMMPWNRAILLPAALAASAAILVAVRRHALATPQSLAAAAPASAAAGTAARRGPDLSAFASSAVLACFAFFVLSALPSIGVTGFLSPTLAARFGTPAETAAAAVTALLAGSAFGTLAGGWLADLVRRPDRVVPAGLAAACLLILAAGQAGAPPLVLVGAFALAGFAAGLTTPSRDLIIRAAAKSGATGRVFGFVYSGYDIGSSLAPLLLGALIDHAAPAWVVPAVAAGYAGMIAAVLLTGGGRRGRGAPA